MSRAEPAGPRRQRSIAGRFGNPSRVSIKMSRAEPAGPRRQRSIAGRFGNPSRVSIKMSRAEPAGLAPRRRGQSVRARAPGCFDLGRGPGAAVLHGPKLGHGSRLCDLASSASAAASSRWAASRSTSLPCSPRLTSTSILSVSSADAGDLQDAVADGQVLACRPWRGS